MSTFLLRKINRNYIFNQEGVYINQLNTFLSVNRDIYLDEYSMSYNTFHVEIQDGVKFQFSIM